MSTERQDRAALLDEAALIFVQLRETPLDPALLAERDAFLARGREAREAYAKIERGWRLAGGRRRTSRMFLLAVAIGLGAALYVGTPSLRLYLVADAVTGVVAERTALASGDGVHLDAGSAIADNTAGGVRAVTLFEGAAVFDVARGAQPFVVSVGDAEVTVLGTVFETALRPDGFTVSVVEGVVEVRIAASVWSVERGSRLEWSPGRGGTVGPIDIDDVAAWRRGQLVVKDMPLGDIAEIIDRRVRGDIVVLGSALAQTRISGNFDLTDPQAAIRVLAAIAGAEVFWGAPFASVLVRID
ncbi:MAG: FecR domain-containing protein [Pseudomonadota bacterium]